MLRKWLGCLALLSLGSLGQAQELPSALEDWQSWVLRDLPTQVCPLLHPQRAEDSAGYACAWPQRLRVSVDEAGAAFEGTVRLYAQDWLPLPGNARYWPNQLLVNGRSAPVVERNGAPALWLPAGDHRLEGRLDWSQRPSHLPIPPLYGWLELTVDGTARNAPERSADGLWLGLPREQPGTGPAVDTLDIHVTRRLQDGIPMLLETRLRLTVSGSLREVSLRGVLPPDFEPLQLDASVDAGLHTEDGLFLLLRPGVHTVSILARARTPLPALAATRSEPPWPASELWSYASDSALRSLELSGGISVDPLQEDIPAEWQRLPAWRLTAGTPLTLRERSRGQAELGRARLVLEREAWIDFHSLQLQTRDRITGTTGGLQRLELPEPWNLLRAELDGQPQPLSAGSTGERGVELRSRELNLTASARVDARQPLRVAGWDQPFDSVRTTLHLPPGELLLAAPGADRAPQTWIAIWDLLDLFLLLLTSMLVARLLGRRWGVLTFALLAVCYPDYPLLLAILAGAAACQLLREAVRGAGAFARFVAAVRNGLAIGLVLVSLPFIASQLRLALYPQLEMGSISTVNLSGPEFGVEMDSAGLVPMVAERAAQRTKTMAELDSGTVLSAPSALPPAAEITLRAAAGLGEPAWQWRSYTLSWNGPVAPQQEMRLLILPRWLISLLRVLSVIALAALLWRWWQRARHHETTSPPISSPMSASAALALLAVVMLPTLSLAPGIAQAQALPDEAQLQALRSWLLQPPVCVPQCVEMPAAALLLDERGARLTLDVHVSEPSGLPLPRARPDWQLTALRINGESDVAVRQEGEQRWLWLERGVHRVELEAIPGGSGNALNLQFPRPPRQFALETVAGWSASGLADGRLSGDSLELRFEPPPAEGDAPPPSLSYRGLNAAPFVRVSRQLELGSEWRLITRIERVAPQGVNLAVTLPLWPGESPLDETLDIRDGNALLTLSASQQARQWESRLAPQASFAVTAGDLSERSETWRISTSPLWRMQSSGTPVVDIEDPGAVYRFRPLPGETLQLAISAVDPLEGPWLAVDSATQTVRLGRRSAESELTALLRTTRAGNHTVQLPPGAELLDVLLDGRPQALRAPDGELRLSLVPGAQNLLLRWRNAADLGSFWRSATPDLGVSTANIQIDVEVSDQRWTLWTAGPLLGPAVLYWAALAVVLLLAAALSRSGRTPLKLRHWLLLGLGFSTLSWLALLFVVAWLLAVDWRERASPSLGGRQRNGAQVALGIFTVLALIVLISVIPAGLLGEPDMQVVGNGSSADFLRWFADRSDGPIPTVTLISLPLWVYRVVILLWAVWLAAALLSWLRWTWQAMGAGGYWWRAGVDVVDVEEDTKDTP